jgi:hypothetical protein
VSIVIVLLFIIGSIFFHPFGDVRTVGEQKPLLHGAQVEPVVFHALERSCANCHSDRTTWPWYSYVAPVSWLVEKDVSDGRAHFNMSRWDEYTLEERTAVLAEISAMVRKREMPLARYTILHPGAKLTAEEIQSIDQWGRQERKRVEEADQQPQGSVGKAGSGTKNAIP